MKKKSLFLLGSLIMAGGLIGSTFAAWAVTDDANPFDIKVSTGSIMSDDTKFLTLEWGTGTTRGNVSELAQNTYRKANVLDLVYSHTETEPDDIYGVLTMRVSATGKLAEKLHVEAYKQEITADANDVISTENYTAAQSSKLSFTDDKSTFKVTTPNTTVTVVVYLDSTTSAADMQEMEALQATISYDWDLRESDKVPAYTIYASGFAAAPSIYAWSETAIIGDWPGITMTAVTDKPGLYTAQVKTTYTEMVISGQLESEGARIKTNDITIATATAGNKFWFDVEGSTGEGDAARLNGTWRTLASGEHQWYLRGLQFNNWANPADLAEPVALVEDGGVWKATNVSLTTDSTAGENHGFKAYNVFTHEWAGNGDDNVTVTSAGAYDITYNPAGSPKVTAVAHSA